MPIGSDLSQRLVRGADTVFSQDGDQPADLALSLAKKYAVHQAVAVGAEEGLTGHGVRSAEDK